MTRVSRRRHIAKTISYRILSTSTGFLTLWVLTGSVEIGGAFSVMELVYKPVQYYLHERLWYKHIRYGVERDRD
jgi:uncharacterized membrane protein